MRGYGYGSNQQGCAKCPRGYYQPNIGRSKCRACSQDTTTFKEGATSNASCYEVNETSTNYQDASSVPAVKFSLIFPNSWGESRDDFEEILRDAVAATTRHEAWLVEIQLLGASANAQGVKKV